MAEEAAAMDAAEVVDRGSGRAFKKERFSPRREREGGEQEKGLSLSALIQTDENRAREEAPRKAAAAAVAAPISYLSVE